MVENPVDCIGANHRDALAICWRLHRSDQGIKLLFSGLDMGRARSHALAVFVLS
jgi:hypothetical protein